MGDTLEGLIGSGMIVGGVFVDALAYLALGEKGADGNLLLYTVMGAGTALIGTGFYLLYHVVNDESQTRPMIPILPRPETKKPWWSFRKNSNF